MILNVWQTVINQPDSELHTRYPCVVLKNSHYLQANMCCMEVEDGICFLPCQPFQRLQVQATTMTIAESSCWERLARDHLSTKAATLEQRTCGFPIWQNIILRPADGETFASDAVGFIWLPKG